MDKKLDPSRCCESVRGEGRWPSFHQCRFKARVTVEGKPYCTMHDPRRVEQRKEESERRWNENWNKRRYEIHGRTFYNALKLIAEGHNDPRALAAGVLKDFHDGERD